MAQEFAIAILTYVRMEIGVTEKLLTGLFNNKEIQFKCRFWCQNIPYLRDSVGTLAVN
jgi:hypothetical protein